MLFYFIRIIRYDKEKEGTTKNKKKIEKINMYTYAYDSKKDSVEYVINHMIIV